jgi:hypothetical protein
MYCVRTPMLRTAVAMLRRCRCDTARTLRTRIFGFSLRVGADRLRKPLECGGGANGSTRLAAGTQKGALVATPNEKIVAHRRDFKRRQRRHDAFAGSFTPRFAPLAPDGLRPNLCALYDEACMP